MISIVIPVYNERPTLPIVLERLKKLSFKKEIIIVDDGSTDGTSEFLKGLEDPEIKVFFHSRNMGKGSSLRTAFKYIKGDIIVIQDADLEYNPRDIPKLLQPILDGYADVVYGSRFLGPHRAYLFTHYLGNKLLNLIANILYNTFLTDLMSGYKVFRREVVNALNLKSEGFGIEAEITAEILKRNFRVYEVPISYSGRTYEEGKKIRWYHFFVEIYWLIKKKFTSTDIPLETLFQMVSLRNYNRWIMNLIKPNLGKRILDIGAGIGNILQHLLTAEEIVVMDISEENIFYLKAHYGIYPNIKILKQDITHPSLEKLKGYKFDTIICLNVLEHIREQEKALANIYNLMDKDTKFIIMVPALPMLMGKLDFALGHCRRYKKEDLIKLLDKAGFYIEKINYLNLIGGLGYFINSKILRRKNYSGFQLWVFDKLVGILRLEKLERRFNLPFGVSLFAVCRKK